jgi:membrane-associated protease RseP (regulator of RpoE activity)
MVLAVLALLLLIPAASAAGTFHPAIAPSSVTPTAALGGISVVVTADGKPTAGATSVGSAVTVSMDSPVNVTFAYSAVGGAVTVGLARLQLFVLGVVTGSKELSITDAHPSPSGSVSVVGDYTYAKYLIEGVYAMHATLLDPNGSTLFAETFYLKVHAPYELTAVTVVFALLLVYEVVAVVSMGSARAVANQVKAAEAARGEKPGGGSP